MADNRTVEAVEKITAWITRYALTDGIQKVQGEIDQENPCEFDYGAWNFAIGDQWHLTEKAAMDHAETMRTQRIASLKRSLFKTEMMRIKIVDRTK